MNSNSSELISVLITMGVLFILALIAVALFIRQWRKETKEGKEEGKR